MWWKAANRWLSSDHTVVLAAPTAHGCFACFVGFVINDWGKNNKDYLRKSHLSRC